MPRNYAFVQVLGEYLKFGMAEHGLKLNTQQAYEWAAVPLRRFFRGYYLGYDVDSMPAGKHLNGSAIERYRHHRLREVSVPTVQKELVVASNAVKYQRVDKCREVPNPFEDRIMPKKYLRRVRPRTVILPRDREAALLMACVQPARDMVRLMLASGLRKTETRLLRWEMVKEDSLEFSPDDHKAGDWSARYLRPDAVEIIQRQDRCSEYVFTLKGAPVTKDWFRTRWEDARRAAGIPGLTIHDLRRSCGHRLREDGVPPNIIQLVLGHADYETSERVYAPPQLDAARAYFSNFAPRR